MSDAALVTPTSDQLQIEDQQKRLNVSKAIPKPVTTLSEFVDSSLCSKYHSDQMNVKNAWLANALNPPSQTVSKEDIHKK